VVKRCKEMNYRLNLAARALVTGRKTCSDSWYRIFCILFEIVRGLSSARRNRLHVGDDIIRSRSEA
jgi:hypothetical protein